ncbi:MAG: hypothetical protein WCH39_15755 [Schlesneria sp.]
MTPKRTGFTERAARKILDATRRVLSHGDPVNFPDYGGVKRFGLYEGHLITDLSSPTNGRTSPTTCTARRWVPDAGSTAIPVPMSPGTSESDYFTLTNRSAGLSAPANTYVIWIRIGNEFRIIWLDCP